jgi:hypothetical protein
VQFHITIGARNAPRLDFTAEAEDACTAAAKHLQLAQVGERVEATPIQRGEHRCYACNALDGDPCQSTHPWECPR